MKYRAKITFLTTDDLERLNLDQSKILQDECNKWYECDSYEESETIDEVNYQRHVEKESREKYRDLTNLIDLLNKLNGSESEDGWLTYKIKGHRLLIDGVAGDLGAFMALMWTKCQHYSFYFSRDEDTNKIEVLYH